MNYFELFEIPVTFSPDTSFIKKKFLELSRKNHPDFFTNANEEEQAEALEKSAQINKAFKILNSRDETLKYVLQLNNMLLEDEKYQLDDSFLMDVMDINEELMDAKMEGDEQKIIELKHGIKNLQKQIYEPVKTIIENYKSDFITEKEMLQVKEYYFQKKYLQRILDGLN